MKNYEVTSLPIDEVISDFAAVFSTTFKEECNLYQVSLPPYVGKGSIRAMSWDNGLAMVMYDCTFNEDVKITFTADSVHPLKFYYCLQGQPSHCYNGSSGSHKLNRYRNVIAASERTDGHCLNFNAHERTLLNSLEVNRIKFAPLMDCDIGAMNSELQKVLLDITGEQRYLHEGDYSLGIARVFDEIRNFQYEDFLRKMFYLAKASEILVHQTIQLNRKVEFERANNPSLMRLEKVKEALELIDKDLAKFDRIENLSKAVGLSGKMLQKEFKQHYGTTINKYVMEKRLEQIVELIENSNMPMSRIAERTGIKSMSYLSKIFKEKYGISPKEYRIRARS